MASVQSGNKRKRSNKEDAPRSKHGDEEITDISSSDNEEDNHVEDDAANGEDIESDEEFQGENPADKRRRLAKQYLENLKFEANEILTERAEISGKARAETEQLDEYNNFDARDLDRDIVGSRLKLDVAEQQGRTYRFIADKLLLKEAKSSFTRVREKNLTCIACFQPQINAFDYNPNDATNNKNKGKIFAYTVSKDLQLTKYDVTDFKERPKKLKYTKGGKKFIPKEFGEHNNTTEGHYDEILTVAASPDGKYVVTGGRDRKLIIWSSESLAPIKVIPTKDRNGTVMSLAFRKNTDQLYAACADYKIRTFSINQFSQLEILYGHQDLVADITALNMERCVTVGSRDRTAMLWKIPDETRLTFRGGDDTDRLFKKWMKQNAVEQEDGTLKYPDESECPKFYGEGSLEVVSMIDDAHFVTGSDNGNLCLWSLAKKKPLFVQRVAHGIIPSIDQNKISGESQIDVRKRQIQDKNLTQPYWISAIHAIPYSNVFISGSWNGSLKLWKVHENLREFTEIGELSNCKGVVTKIQVVESGRHGRENFRILASVAKEHKLGRWIGPIEGGRNGIYSAVIEQSFV